MTTAATIPPRPARPLKSPLAVPGNAAHRTADAGADADTPSFGRAVLSDREATLAEIEDYLRTVNRAWTL